MKNATSLALDIHIAQVVLWGDCPSIHADVDLTADVVLLTELGGICPELGWHDAPGLSCRDWINWGILVDIFIDTW